MGVKGCAPGRLSQGSLTVWTTSPASVGVLCFIIFVEPHASLIWNISTDFREFLRIFIPSKEHLVHCS